MAATTTADVQTTDQPALLSIDGAVATITLNRPTAFNSINLAIAQTLEQLAAQITADDTIRVVIIEGNGRAFCAGGDLQTLGHAGDRIVPVVHELLAHYHAFYSDPRRIHATCEDYRAGRTTDLRHDEIDRAAGKKITCPVLAIWGADGGVAAETDDPLAAWREWAHDVRGFALDCGHYLAEEAPEATTTALIEFFEQP